MTPEFAEHLVTVKENDRRGHVFKLIYGHFGKPVNRTRHPVGKYVSEIGKAAKVVTRLRDKKGEVLKESATAHDLARSLASVGPVA